MSELFQKAASLIECADALLIGAGAGMGVDSGLPDFRGDEGFWKAYPAFRGRQFSEMSNPMWFSRDPQTAWGFFGHRYNLYRNTVPHLGFGVLNKLSERFGGNTAIFTSNVDGQFQKSKLAADVIVECHGSIHHLQCVDLCSDQIWEAGELSIKVDEDIRASEPLPRCPNCGGLARPNILMFGDYAWIDQRTGGQMQRYDQWLKKNEGSKVVAIEIGAGMAIPTVRLECQRQATGLVRINPRDGQIDGSFTDDNAVGIPLGAVDALTGIAQALEIEIE